MILLNALSALSAVTAPIAEEIPDADDVKPGWIGFTVVVLLAVAVVLLVFSFRKQLRKVDFEESGDDAGTRTEDGEEPGSTRSS